MPELNFSIDLHCHPQYKAFGRAHSTNGQPPRKQDGSVSHRSSMWHYDPPNPLDKLLNYTLGITKFSQTNLTASAHGRLLVLVVGMGCIEKAFFRNKMGTGPVTDLIDDFVAEFGRPRINTIEAMADYWKDLTNEMQFLQDQENRPMRIDGFWFTYRMVRDFNQLQQNIAENEKEAAGKTKETPIVVSLIPSVEGLHVLNCGLESPCDPISVKQNAIALKSLSAPPWFVTFSHHFYNELCGHARSLRNEIGKLTNQETGINAGFTDLGWEVLDILLDNANGKRISPTTPNLAIRLLIL
jgi:hypothetical protein